MVEKLGPPRKGTRMTKQQSSRCFCETKILKKNIGRPSTYSRAVHAVGLSGERRPWQPLQRPGADGGPAPHSSRDPAACGVTSSRPPGTQAPVLCVAAGPTDPLGSETQRHARLERREPGRGAGPRGPSFQSLCFPCSRR